MKRKQWIIIAVAAVILILLAIPAGTIISINNSSYNCSFPYEKISADSLLTDMARKNVYYNAKDKTVEIFLAQDALNSLIKDNLASFTSGLPANIKVKEAMFEAEDQRLYVNAKYGSLNVPLSFKISIQPDKDGITITAADINLGKNKAPGYILKQIPESMLKMAFKFSDFNVPQVFTLKEVKFGTGIIKAVIALDEAKVTDLAAGYWNDAIESIKKSNSENEFLSVFLDRAIKADVLSEKAARDYIKQALNNEELVNCAIIFAVSGNLDKYPAGLQEYGKKLAEWASPLQTLKYYGSVDETVGRILYDEKLKDFLAWFIPGEIIKEYSSAIEEYYTLYKDTMVVLSDISESFGDGRIEYALDTILNDPVIKEALGVFVPAGDLENYTGTFNGYLAQYRSIKGNLDKTTAGIDTAAVKDYTNMAVDFADVAKRERVNVINSLRDFDTALVDRFVKDMENDRTIKDNYLSYIDPYYYEQVKIGLSNTGYARDVAVDVLETVDNRKIDSYVSTLKKLRDFLLLLKKQQYIPAAESFPAKDIMALIP